MRRFSQRNSLVTLSDINITPLLDLAFVLLLIFVITRPLLEQSMDLRLPPGGRAPARINPNNVRTIEIGAEGLYKLERRVRSLAQIEQELVQAAQANPELVVYIRADENGYNKHLYAVIDLCQRNGLTKFKLATQPARAP